MALGLLYALVGLAGATPDNSLNAMGIGDPEDLAVGTGNGYPVLGYSPDAEIRRRHPRRWPFAAVFANGALIFPPPGYVGHSSAYWAAS